MTEQAVHKLIPLLRDKPARHAALCAYIRPLALAIARISSMRDIPLTLWSIPYAAQKAMP